MRYAIPDWLSKALGDFSESSILWTDSKSYIVSHKGEKDKIYDDLVDAYDSTDVHALILDASLTGKNDFFTRRTDDGFYRMFSGFTDDETAWDLECAFFGFADTIYPRYLNNPDSFVASYDFLSKHPAFWIRERAYESISKQHWITESLLSRHSIVPEEVGNTLQPVFRVELGGSASPEHTTTYFDEELSLKAPSYEQAVIEAAAMIEKYFWVTGEIRLELENGDVILGALRTLHAQNLAEMNARENPYS